MVVAPISYLQRFAEAAARHALRPAVIEGPRTVSYGELDSNARRIARQLVDSQALPRVLIHLPQTAEAFAAMFAVAQAGGFYTTTNVAAPPERRKSTFEAFAPAAIITNGELAAEARRYCPSAHIVDVDTLGREELATPAEPHRLAYVMFTSGSTGQPKGVMISKSALSHYVDWVMDAMAVTPEDRWSQHPNIAFDLSVLDIYGALCAGAALIPITGVDLLMPAQAIRRHGLTIWDSVPSVLTSMIKIRQATPKNFESLRMLTFCGEALQKMHVEAIFNARPDIVVHNTYGPTEATVSCTLLRLTAANYEAACQSSVAIGDPIPGMAIDLVGGADGNDGEIVISGPQVAEGYWNDPALTAEKFRRFEAGGSEKFGYFTGDWAQRAGPHVYFRGRVDNQVKVRGERIELDDISAALMNCGCGFACVVKIGDELHGMFEYDDAIPEAQALRETIGKYLPVHLIPQHFHAMASLPRNANGKVDLAAVCRWIEERNHSGAAGRGQ